MDQDSLDRLSVTRARVEAAASGPAVIAVTAARRTDGTEFLAYGLARSLVAVGRDVLFVLSGGAGDGRRAVREGRSGEPSRLDLPGAHSLDAARAAFEEFRQRFAFTLVDAALAHKDGSALSLARAADFVLIAVEQGRSSGAEDRELAFALRSAHANTLGVITIDRRAIRGFERAAETRLSVRPALVEEPVGRNAPLASRLG